MYVYLLKWFLSDEPSDFTLRAYDWGNSNERTTFARHKIL